MKTGEHNREKVTTNESFDSIVLDFGEEKTGVNYGKGRREKHEKGLAKTFIRHNHLPYTRDTDFKSQKRDDKSETLIFLFTRLLKSLKALKHRDTRDVN